MARVFEFEVELLDIQTRIWRRFQLGAMSSFETLHQSIQQAFGWECRHLYEFRRVITSPNIRRIARSKQAEILDDEIVPFADDLTLDSFFAEKETSCLYLYDFGDGWQHLVQLRDAVNSCKSFTRRLLDGAMACRPEDCGGPIGFERMLQILQLTEVEVAKLDEAERPEVEWLRQRHRDWTPNAFDLASARSRFDG